MLKEVTLPITIQDFLTKDIEAPQKEWSHSRFFVTLPSGGNYQGKFFIVGPTLPASPLINLHLRSVKNWPIMAILIR